MYDENLCYDFITVIAMHAHMDTYTLELNSDDYDRAGNRLLSLVKSEY